MTAVRLVISGRVQGVGYRYWMREQAEPLGVSGWVRNRSDGSVEAVVEGDATAVSALIAVCRSGPPGAAVADVIATAAPEGTEPGFAIRPTE